MSTLAPARVLRAGCAPALPLPRLFDFMRALRAREPGLAIEVTHLPSPDQITRLCDGELDLGIVFDGTEHADLDTEPLFAGDAVVACLPAGHRLAEHPIIRPADVRDETLVTGQRSLNPAVYDKSLAQVAEAGYHFKRVEQSGAASARELLVAVASGLGISLAPASLGELSEAVPDVILRPLDPPLRYPSTNVAWCSKPPARLRAILGTVREVARELFALAEVEESRPRSRDLTARQLEVLRLLAEGRSTREIAHELHLSETTVRNHVAGLTAALGVHTRLQAVIAARRAGLLLDL